MHYRRFDVHADPLHFGEMDNYKTITSTIFIIGAEDPSDFPALVREQLAEFSSSSTFFQEKWNVSEQIEKNFAAANGFTRPEEQHLQKLIAAAQVDLGSIAIKHVFVELRLEDKAVTRFRITAGEQDRFRIIYLEAGATKTLQQYAAGALIGAIEAKF
ncbi:hypothetical protein Rleg9DRAFT_2109 [Rhizobium leguminosarum bv. trifolii WSM597]|uniref:Uncharacterized protein n=1 Tax=Rhizobium leguminosarum bv. trifolii WSM597 TaxID=754764 RepID=I9N987_RHILT|nr:hypothetical protein [Rhizobium leguminosarum]EJB03277.1 hypothetical protein Rleg9DRAFT_2109 [Rhizobium leguminosarum bv. trifolii WSM597]